MGYTIRYSKTYEQWARLKAERIHRVLWEFFVKKTPLSMSYLIQTLYFERLGYENIFMWKPIKDLDPETFTDFKPSAPMLNFLKHLIRSLVELGYLEEVFCIIIDYEDDKLIVKDSWFQYVVKSVPSMDFLTEFCTWKDPMPYPMDLEDILTPDFEASLEKAREIRVLMDKLSL